MMTDERLKNLRIHLMQIASSLTSELTESNVILSLDDSGRVFPEAVCNHHLTELLSQLSPAVFAHYCNAMFGWLADSKNGYSGHPFTLDTYTKFCEVVPENTELLRKRIAVHQLGDGSNPVYTAHTQGGDFFSTLWATKILIQYDASIFSEEISKAVQYLLAKQGFAARSVAQKGYLMYVLLLSGVPPYSREVQELYQEIFTASEAAGFDGEIMEAIDAVYLLEDLLLYHTKGASDAVLNLVEERLASLFELDETPKLPRVFEKWSNLRPQQAYFLYLLKAGVLAAKYLRAVDYPLPTVELNAHLHERYREIKYIGQRALRELKHYKQHYDLIEAEFSRYEDKLQSMWTNSESEYETSIFLMMPFRESYAFRGLTDEIRRVCKASGYTAFRVDDPFRSPFDTLWDNIVVNMLGCKYGISVYVSDRALDWLSDEVRFFQNPNVALEFGFMKSRGKRVLVLKDQDSIAPSDLQGFVWRPFDIVNPDKTVEGALAPWLNELSQERKGAGGDP